MIVFLTAQNSTLLYLGIAGGFMSLLLSTTAVLKGLDFLLGRRIDDHQNAILEGQKTIEKKVDEALTGLAKTKVTDDRQDIELKEHGERLAWVEGTLGKPLHSTHDEPRHVATI